jgi:L-ascorbate metabolism protein UlaG (beta-lactamase superfamily)
MDENIRKAVESLQLIGHSTVRYSGSKTFYIDPWKLPSGMGADGDLILVTHDHYDHLSISDIKKALAREGKVLVSECCRGKFGSADLYTLPYMKHRIAGIEVYATAAYNVNKQFHQREMGHCGYIIEIDGVKIYHSGDCDAFPHMRDFTCDIALLPVSGTYVMNSSEAVDAVNMLNPKVAIPIHWGDPDVVGTRADAETFKKLSPCEVVILDPVR